MSTEVPKVSGSYVPYKFDGNYSRGELLAIQDFMNKDFPRICFKTRHGGSVSIEYPKPPIVSQFEWESIVNSVLLPELDILHPRMLKRKMTVRFVDTLYDYKNDTYAGGSGYRRGNNHWIRIPYRHKFGEVGIIYLTFVIMHELIESDFWVKTLKTDLEANQIQEIENGYFLNNVLGYRNLLDEKVANRRALKAVRRYWFDADWTDPSQIYDEDRSM